MKPSDCKTAHQARMAGRGIYEARLTGVRVTGRITGPLYEALRKLEHTYWKRADELAKKKPKRRVKRRGK